MIAGIERRMFYKSMTTFADHRVWQDVYHVPARGMVLYVKFQADVITEFVVAGNRPFHLGGPVARLRRLVDNCCNAWVDTRGRGIGGGLSVVFAVLLATAAKRSGDSASAIAAQME
ncbi:type II toxin-antitoxin system MqsR family toxin [Sinorhizobium meliloti]|uniref:type II toxin-antitoxin system MqsR family toxin n=1 Tax=Rhizobium meliloti TaxID=382 RepID=UPI003B3A808D